MELSQADLRSHLTQLDQRSYKAYRELGHTYTYPDFTLKIDRIQGDPFAAPSQIRVQVPQTLAAFPPELWATPIRAIALRDFLNRQIERATTSLRSQRGSGNSGLIAINAPGPCILERSAVMITPEGVEARLVVGLPAWGRRIAGAEAIALLCDDLPAIVAQSLHYEQLEAAALQAHLDVAEDFTAIQAQLRDRGLVAFIADGSILPRQSGVSDRPLAPATAQPWQSPPTRQVTLTCPHRGSVTGTGIPSGITLLVGGGYHGKSTVLQAITQGIYPHIPGDGREYVVTDPTAVKIRAEDGRSVAGVNLSPLINHLPRGQSATNFSTTNASGSTSQAASLLEAIAAGATTILIDEDTAATNLLIRDRRMQALIHKAQEPITPLIDKIRPLFQDYGVSSILVMGGCGDYFEVADTVIALENFSPRDVTIAAQRIAAEYPSDRQAEGDTHFGPLTPRYPHPASLNSSRGAKTAAWSVRGRHTLRFGTEDLELTALEQLVEPGQLRAIATLMVALEQRGAWDGHTDLLVGIDREYAALTRSGWDELTRWPMGDLVACRRLELVAVLNRLRSLRLQPGPPSDTPSS